MEKNNLKNSQNNDKIQSGSSAQAGIGANLGTAIGRFFWMVKYAEEQERGFIWTALIGKTMDVIRVLLPLYLSQVVLSSIYNGHKMADIFIKTVIVTVSFFLLTVLSGYFQKKAKYHYRRFYLYCNRNLSGEESVFCSNSKNRTLDELGTEPRIPRAYISPSLLCG